MTLKKGRFAKWNGKEYELASYQRVYYLTSDNPASVKTDGFRPQQGMTDRFIREVSVRDLDHAYEIIPYAVYESHRFMVEGVTDDGKAVLITNDPFVQEKLPVRPYGKHEFIIEVPLDELEIQEDLIPILGFSKKPAF
ncbi:hypothetical protein [Bhargavaea cecembensis]|uniref:hypothetical protein n=1 Tax=Bhargavaea cecembensis TaxID=394098 RepID=UPI000590C320|nr:hypothetical protein [Bhargavaea cecembensis]